MPRDQWIRLKKGDDWGHEYVAIDPLNERGMADSGRGLKLRAGEKVTVRWPDGSVSDTSVVLERYHAEVSDMGNSYGVEGRRPSVRLTTRGIESSVPIWDVEVQKEWAKRHA